MPNTYSNIITRSFGLLFLVLPLSSCGPNFQANFPAIVLPQLVISGGVDTLRNGGCSTPYTISLKDPTGEAIASSDTDVQVQLHADTGSFYAASDVNCTGSTITSLTIAQGSGSASFKYLGNANLSSLHLSAEASGYQAGTRTLSTVGCPTNFVLVPANAELGTESFCVAKYEMKNVGGNATSQAANAPWVAITRADAEAACQDAGFDMITNVQWQAMARNIEVVGDNWDGGEVGAVGKNINQGHSDSSPASAQAAGADSDPCANTGQTCSLTLWDSQRRTNFLSNGDLIWDVGGNVAEWVSDDLVGTSYGLSDRYAYTLTGAAQDDFGPSNVYASDPGFGFTAINYAGGGAARGGIYVFGAMAGVFFADLSVNPTVATATTGFRCVSEVSP